MIMTNELRDELYGKNRLELKDRIHRNVFFPTMPVVGHIHHDTDELDLDWGLNVNFLDSFQSLDDFHNELRAMLIKPLMCEYLSAKHQLALSFELSMLLIDCLTLSPFKAFDSAGRVVNEFLLSGFYAVNGVIAETTAVASFVLRCLMTIADVLYRLSNPAEQEQLPVAAPV